MVGVGRRASIVARSDLRATIDRIDLAYADLSDPAAVADAIQQHRPGEIYNLASQSAPALSWSRPDETAEITGVGAHRLFEAARRFLPQCRIYQASSSEMYGEVIESPQNERTPFNPSNPYAAAKVYAHHMAHVYRRGYGMFISCGILFNHESPLRPMRFVTQKVAHGAACAKLGIRESPQLNEEGDPIVASGKLSLGNLDAARDWGHARDYVEAMWLMLQQATPDDYVIGTGRLRTIRDLCATAYGHVGCDWQEHVVSQPRLKRPLETGPTVADTAKAGRMLGWTPTIGFDTMIAEMVDAQLAALRAAPGR